MNVTTTNICQCYSNQALLTCKICIVVLPLPNKTIVTIYMYIVFANIIALVESVESILILMVYVHYNIYIIFECVVGLFV